MGLTNDGADFHAGNMIGASVTQFDNANAALGVGDDNTAFSASQSQLQAEANATNAIRKGMDSGFPKRDPESNGDDNKLRFQATFASGEANFAWEEWGLFNDTTAGAGTMHNREVTFLGTKTSAMSWTYQVDVSITL